MLYEVITEDLVRLATEAARIGARKLVKRFRDRDLIAELKAALVILVEENKPPRQIFRNNFV